MNMRTAVVLALALAVPSVASAQNQSATDPLTAGARAQFAMVKDVVIRTAQKVPEDLYAFRPTPEVRSFAQLFGHIADGFLNMCATAASGTPPRQEIETTLTRKADLVKALNDGAAYCESVMAAMTDRKGVETVQFYFGPTPRTSVLYFAVAHGYEHYGNLVTYMRLKGIVPPSSETPAATPAPAPARPATAAPGR
jgi:uncharacterized damage-inducible protein DinB